MNTGNIKWEMGWRFSSLSLVCLHVCFRLVCVHVCLHTHAQFTLPPFSPSPSFLSLALFLLLSLLIFLRHGLSSNLMLAHSAIPALLWAPVQYPMMGLSVYVAMFHVHMCCISKLGDMLGYASMISSLQTYLSH